MSQEQPPDRQKTSLDVDEVIDALKTLSEQAAAGAVHGFMLSYIDETGAQFCASAGVCSRNPKASLVGALEALVQLCAGTEPPQPSANPIASASHVLH